MAPWVRACGERVRRGLFFAFAAGMAVCARDPLGRERGFLILLACSGLLHAGEMAVDNLIAAHAGGANGNPQHLYGDVLGWAVIGASALALSAISRRTRRPP